MPPIESIQRNHIRQVLLDRETYATVLLHIAIDTFGTELFEWTRDTVASEFMQEYGLIMPTTNLDKIMAAIGIITTDSFFKSIYHFIQYCNVLCGDVFDPYEFDPATVAEMAWGITEALILYPPDEDEPFTDDIRYYIGMRLKYEGFVRPPNILRIALFDGDMSDALAEYGDDPDFQAKVRAERQDRGALIDNAVKENVQKLLTDLEKLSLTNGDTKKAVDELRRGA